jgi:hypothetical protein
MTVEAVRLLISHETACKGLSMLAQAVAMLVEAIRVLKEAVRILLHCKKCLPFFPSPGGMSLTKPSLAGNNLIIPVHGEFG